jgi:predicted ester cyclase
VALDRCGKADLRRAIDRLSTVLADANFTVEDLIVEGDRVAVRVTARATQVGEFLGVAPTGRAYAIGEIHIFRIRDGQVVEHWHQYDQVGMMRQLGALPG